MNETKLRNIMRSKGVKVNAMVEKLGISRTAFWRKCKGISEFTRREMEIIVRELQLERPGEVFFDTEVS